MENPEKKCKEILDRVPDGYYEVDLKGNFVFCNNRMCEFLQYSITELVGINFSKITLEKDTKNVFKKFNEVFKELRAIDLFQFEIVRKDGKKFLIESSVSLKYDSNNKKVGFCGVARDITSRKEAEQKLKESEAKYRFITENANDMIGIINDKTEYAFINEYACKKFLGYECDELIGKKGLDFIHREDVEVTLQAVEDGRKNGEAKVDIRFKHKDGRWIWLEVNGKRFFDKDGTLKGIVIARDITEKKTIEAELKKSKEKNHNAFEKVNFYKDLLTHDTNNILQNILFASELCSIYLNENNKREKLFELLTIIKDQTKKGAELISKIRKLSDLEDTQMTIIPTEICDMLRNSIIFAKKSFKDRDINIEINSFSDTIFVKANNLLSDVFENILINGIIHNKNPRVELCIRISKVLQKGVNYVKIEFNDNGIGISDDQKKVIFLKKPDEFKDGQRMGLGLSLVKKIVDIYNGQVLAKDRIEGDYKKGCNFIIILPEI